ncbi:MAG: hypothetical protein WD077_09160 [Bacteroidia bacterium]
MKWKYYIPHNLRKEISTSEDIYILGENSKSVTYWITITSIGFFGGQDEELFHPTLFHQVMKNLSDRDYWINGTDMYINAMSFTESELLKWLKLWLEKKGMPCQSLQKGTLQEFRRKNRAIDAFETAFENMVNEYFKGNTASSNS